MPTIQGPPSVAFFGTVGSPIIREAGTLFFASLPMQESSHAEQQTTMDESRAFGRSGRVKEAGGATDCLRAGPRPDPDEGCIAMLPHGSHRTVCRPE